MIYLGISSCHNENACIDASQTHVFGGHEICNSPNVLRYFTPEQWMKTFLNALQYKVSKTMKKLCSDYWKNVDNQGF